MPAKKNKSASPAPAPAAKPIAEPVATPASLSDQAKELNRLIAEKEDAAAPLYFRLGSVLQGIKEERKCNWTALLEYATDKKGLDLRRSRYARALRIYGLYKDSPEKVNGLTVYEALQHKPHDKPEPRAKGSRVSRKEFRALTTFEKSVGSKERAVEVMTRIYINHEEPEEESGNALVTALIKKVTPKRRSECRRNPQRFFGSLSSEIDPELQGIRQNVAGQPTHQTIAELCSEIQSKARRYLTCTQADELSRNPVSGFLELQNFLNKALGVSPAAPQSSTQQPTAETLTAPAASAN
ncbi:MAG: hypothetical protein ACLP9L_12700 [Thermoguttaceae bacterium]